MSIVCKICGNQKKFKIVYSGKIRDGKFGSYIDNQEILRCPICGTQFLNSSVLNINYNTEEYRNLVEESYSENSYYNSHDEEQIYNIEVINLKNVRNKSIVDIGCGAGSFLDAIKGFATKIVAVEPFKYYRNILELKGYKVFGYASNVTMNNQFDIATSFAVIEHVESPLDFLKDIQKLVKKGGQIIISTPNTDDFQLELLGDEYKSFYYRKVHKFYFNKESLTYLSKKIGFKGVEFIYKHKYDMSNLIFWLKDKEPTGLKKTNLLKNLDILLKENLESNGQSNFLYAKFYV
jgi:SAM-dependent methyltransferase